MASRRSNKRRLTTTIAARATWIALTALHVGFLAPTWAPILDGEAGLGPIARAVLLVVATAFFALRAFDAPILRLGGSSRGWCIFLLATALMHHDAVTGVQAEPVAVVIVAAVAARALGRRTGVRLRRASGIRPRRHVADRVRVARVARLHSILSVSRPPPACA